VAARDESGGSIGTVSDEEIIEAYKLLARTEGIFCEPASAASVAGAIKSARAGMDFSSNTIVCIITGHGLKDPSVALALADRPLEEAPADAQIVADMLGAQPKP